MLRIPQRSDRDAFLARSRVVDHDDPAIRTQARRLSRTDRDATIRASFEFVRDEVMHSADHRRSPTTCVASDVLRARTGYCYAKSHLLVALLRAQGIPSGFCYQRLTVDGHGAPFCLHGLVAVERDDGAWFGVDPRGNRHGIDARFEPPVERLAFDTRHPGERDFETVYPEPLAVVVDCLERHDTWEAVLASLPDAEAL